MAKVRDDDTAEALYTVATSGTKRLAKTVIVGPDQALTITEGFQA